MDRIGFWILEKPLFEYLLVISPNEEVSTRVKQIKHLYKREFGCQHAAQSIPHITLIDFTQFESMEAHIVKNFEKLSRSIAPIDVLLTGFDRFPAHTVYIKILNGSSIASITKAIREKFRHLLRGVEKHRPSFTTNPHLSIATKMSAQQFDRAWAEWKEREFKASFNASSMLLMKRKIDKRSSRPLENYKVVKDIPFTGNGKEGVQLMMGI